jgi:hypothetical protein
MKAMTNAELKDTVSAWLAAQRSPSDQELEDDIERLQRGLLEMQLAFDNIYSFLARHPERASQAQPLLVHLLAERQSLLNRLAERLLEWRLSGGTIELKNSSGAPMPPGEGPSLSKAMQVVESLTQAGPGDPVLREPSEVGGDHDDGPPPVSAEVLLAWQQRMKQARAPAARPAERVVPEERQRVILAQLMRALGEPRDLSSTVGTIDEVDALEASTSPEAMAQWAHLSKHLQRAWLAVMVSRTRALKDIPSLSPGLREKIKVIILNFPAFAKQQQPGYVNGLQVAHQPEHGSWLADSLHNWALAREMVREPTPTVVEPPPPPPSKRTRVVEADEAGEEEENDPPAIEPSWPLWDRVRGRRAVLLGGEPREPARQRLHDTFEFGDLEWVPADNPRRLDSLVERVSLEKVDLVLVLQNWIAHKVSNKLIDACKHSGVPWALVGGYGVKAVRAGIERFLSGDEGK